MIKLVACGHTLGGVRSTDFLELVPPNLSSSIPVFDNFDETMQFDNLVVTDYLNNNTTNILDFLKQDDDFGFTRLLK